MRRMPIASLVLAVALAVLPPLEQAHCASMAAQRTAGRVSHAACTRHACCAAAAPAATPSPGRLPSANDRPSCCACDQHPVVTLPIVAAMTDAPATISAIMPADSPGPVPGNPSPEIFPALDVGSPPLPDDPGAHGLRAPPLVA